MMKFEYRWDDSGGNVTMELSSESTLTEVLALFESFLRASGYHFKGTVDILGEDE